MAFLKRIWNSIFKKKSISSSAPKSAGVPTEPKVRGVPLEQIPFAHQHNKRMKTRGEYPLKYPKGAVVHFTAGRYEGGLKKAIDTIDGGIKNGFTFLCISNDGKVVQAHPISQHGYHAGESAWQKLRGSVSDDLIGIEINNAGKLEKTSSGKYMTWFKTEVPEDQVRYVTEKMYACPTGHYHKYTEAQEEALIKTLLFLKENNPEVFDFDFVLGHHEVAGKKGIGRWRKNDPGGALSMPMDMFRIKLKELYAQRQ